MFRLLSPIFRTVFSNSYEATKCISTIDLQLITRLAKVASYCNLLPKNHIDLLTIGARTSCKSVYKISDSITRWTYKEEIYIHIERPQLSGLNGWICYINVPNLVSLCISVPFQLNFLHVYFISMLILLFYLCHCLRKNGFLLEEDMHAPPGHHFKLKAVPFSKNTTFGVEGNPCLGNLDSSF